MKKIATFLFGIISYLVFLAAFLYAIGFVGNFIVPKSIDTGATTTPRFTAIMVNLILLSLFAIQHSVMARPAFKKWWTPIVGPVIERSIYVFLASMALFFMYWKWQPITGVIWEVHSPVLTIFLYALFGAGWLIVLLSTFMINHFELFGLKQVYEYLKNIEPRPVAFKLTLFYSIVRHPIMLGFIIAFWSTPLMTIGHLVFAVTTTLYILIAITYLEERDLLKMHGEKYKEYQARVPKIIPFT